MHSMQAWIQYLRCDKLFFILQCEGPEFQIRVRPQSSAESNSADYGDDDEEEEEGMQGDWPNDLHTSQTAHCPESTSTNPSQPVQLLNDCQNFTGLTQDDLVDALPLSEALQEVVILHLLDWCQLTYNRKF